MIHPVRIAVTLLAQTDEVRWIAPPRGSLRHGAWWVHSPRAFVAIVMLAVAATVALALYRRFRRKG